MGELHVALDEPVRAWLAALIDGEGSVMLNRRTFSDAAKAKAAHAGVYSLARYRPVVCVAATTQYCLMEAIAGRVSGSVYEHRVSNTKPSHNPRARRQWTFRWNVAQIVEYLPQVVPWLVIKQEQATLLLEATEIKNRLNPSTPGNDWYHPHTREPLRDRLDQIYAGIRQANTRGRTLDEEIA